MSAPDLDRMQHVADPLADDTVAAVLGDWAEVGIAERLERVRVMNRLIGGWKTNGDLAGWRAAGEGVTPGIAAPMEAYVQAGSQLPGWMDKDRIARAEQLFFAQGPLSCLLLFCRSLPECYVVPDLAAVLQVSGQLTQHTDYRVRSTAAMIFPVMMTGGLTTPEGGGIAQTLKVRLIHATIRHLILHGNPSDVSGVVSPLVLDGPPKSMHEALLGHGWNVEADGLPCNQEELAYTLLTFSHCFLSSLHRLNLGLGPEDEGAYLHAWNVVGHVLGIHRDLMVQDTPQAQALFEAMQARGRADPVSPDPRPALGTALMNAMSAEIPFRIAKPMPVLMTRHLCGAATSADLGLNGHVSWLSGTLFALGMGLVGLIDRLARLVWPDFSLSRFVVRVLGYHVVTKLLMDQTRPLQLPDHLLARVRDVVAQWSEDPKAPRWLNVMEDRFTTIGTWKSVVRR
jgi:hypothetical protein